MTEKKYEQVHLFIDESGNLVNPQDTLLVGGIALFGAYSSKEDHIFKNFVVKLLLNVGGKYPDDLHFGRSSLSDDQWTRFLTLLSSDIASLSSYNHLLYGLSIHHVSDYHNNLLTYADEKLLDNRYIQMLWALIEYHLFIDDKFSTLLSSNAKIHLHISRRGFPFKRDDELKKVLEKSGYKVVVDIGNNSNYFVDLTLRDREIVGMLRMAQSQRWKKSGIQFDSIEIANTDYKNGNSSIPLYLADIYLGTVRKSVNMSAHYHEKSFIPALRQVEYGPWLELLAEMKAAVMNDHIDQFVALADQYDVSYSHMNQYNQLIDTMERKAASLLKIAPDKFLAYMENAGRIVDQAGLAKEGICKADRVFRLMYLSETLNIGADILYLQARLSYANHTGDVSTAESVWLDYEKKEPELYKIGAEGLRLMAEMRNRRAVSLTDMFRYQEAKEVLAKIVFENENELDEHARRFNINRNDLPNYELGACYGTLGQLYAFIGTEEAKSNAAGAFARAISRFAEPKDIDRQYIYLGHLACDMGVQGRSLWNRVEEKLLGSKCLEPINETATQFRLHLQAKGILVFGTKEDMIGFLSRGETCKNSFKYSDQETDHHPFGLIYQITAMICVRLWREFGKQQEYVPQAINYFNMAKTKMRNGGALLQLLAYMADIRRLLFELEINGNDANIADSLTYIINLLKAHVIKQFNDYAWGEDENGKSYGYFGDNDPGMGSDINERAKNIINKIRFHYW